MPQSAKIATCNYCGTRAALVLEPGQHELACGACGAPLHDMKRLRRDHPSKPSRPGKEGKHAKPGKPKKKAQSKPPKDPWVALAEGVLHEVSRKSRGKSRRKSKRGLTGHLMKELKDIFD